MFRICALSAFSAVLLSALPAASLTLECKIPESAAGGGYVTDLYVFEYDEDAGQAIVADALILNYNNEQPVVAKVSDDSEKKLVITWRVLLTNGTGQTANMQFRASYFKADKSVIVRASPGGDYSDNFEGRGKCKAI